MLSSKRLFGTNGIRGLVNKQLTPEMATKVGSAVGTFFKKGEVIVGHDARTSGPMFAKAVTAGLNSTGCNILFAGMAPTPALQYAVKHHKPSGGVIVTASHNPPEYNGIKVIWNDGIEISHEHEIEIESIYFDERTAFAEWNAVGTARELAGIIDEYIEAVKKHVDTTAISRKNYHIIVDGANSVGSLTGPRLARDLGCKVTTINANIDGTFPGRPPEPSPENLGDLARFVKAADADLGVAYDGDADRSIFVDEKGQIIMGDQTFGLVAKYFLMDNPGENIVTPLSSSAIIKDIAEKNGGRITWTKIGSVTVSQTMKKLKAKLGGEENGGIFYGPHQSVRDGAMTTALILNVMARTGEKLSTLIEQLPKYFIEKSKVECREELKQKVLKKLTEQIKEQETSTLDGVKIWFEDRSSILVRPSGTEPVYRLYAEAKTSRKARQLIRDYSSKLRAIIRSSSEL
jgi:phosphomannomutase/phosphoglucomutase